MNVRRTFGFYPENHTFSRKSSMASTSSRKIFASGLYSPVWEHFGFYMKKENGKEVLDKSSAICKIYKVSLV